MTETTFPFGDVDQADPSAEQAEEKGRGVLLKAGGVVVALAVAAGGFFLLTGGEDVEEETFVPVKRPAAAQAAAGTQKVAVKPAVKLPVPFDEDLGRNPFKALYVEPAAAAGPADDPTLPDGGTAAGTTPGGTVTTTSGGTGTTAGTGTGTGSAGAPAAPQAPTAKEYPLVLKRVYGTGKDQTAEFTIDGRKVVAKVGVRFGPTSEIRLISLQEGPAEGQWTAVLQVGDGEPFDAVTGDKVSVR